MTQLGQSEAIYIFTSFQSTLRKKGKEVKGKRKKKMTEAQKLHIGAKILILQF
jgi:hypothetical protein